MARKFFGGLEDFLYPTDMPPGAVSIGSMLILNVYEFGSILVSVTKVHTKLTGQTICELSIDIY